MPLYHGTLQDLAESVVVDVREAPALASDRHQKCAAAGADSVHQGSHRIATKESWWRPLLALSVFVLWAHPSLVGLPCAALLIIAPGERTGERGSGWSHPIAGTMGAVSLALLVLSGG